MIALARRPLAALAAAVVALAALAVAAPAPPASAAPVQALLLGDSVMAGLTSSAKASLGARHSFVLDAVVCRRLISASCTYQGVTPANALDTLRARAGQFDGAVVVAVGYNDSAVGSAVDAIVAEARRQGVDRVIWLTYRQAGTYASMYAAHNATLRAKLAQHPELRLADWASLSAGQSSWVGADGLHLTGTGAMQMADLIGDALDTGLAPDRCDPAAGVGAVPGLGGAGPGEVTGGVRLLATPQRLLDTRNGTGPLGAGRVLAVPAAGVGQVPGTATGLVITVTAALPCAPTYVAAGPCGVGVGGTSTVNALPGQIVANAAVVALGAGALCLYAPAAVDVIVDVTGWLEPGGDGLQPVPPRRLVDTRLAETQELTVGQGRRAAGAVTTIPIAGALTPGATGAAVNLTAVDPAQPGYVTLYPGPCSGAAPVASAVVALPARTVAAGIVVGVGGDGTVCALTSAPMDLIVDLVGQVVTGGPQVRTVAPRRLLDSRAAAPVTAGGQVALDLDDTALAAPAGAVGALLNTTSDRTVTAGFLTVRPCSPGGRPATSTVNPQPGRAVANLAVTGVDGDRRLCAWSATTTDVLLDVTGWLVAAG